MAKIMHVQTVLTVEDIEALKQKTGEISTKEALSKAVTHYLQCEYTQVGDICTEKLEKIVKRTGVRRRKPMNEPSSRYDKSLLE